MKATVIVTAQLFENYSFDSEGNLDSENPYWKKKGGHEVQLKVDADIVMYQEDEFIGWLHDYFKKESGDFYKYEYLDHDVTFGDIEDITEQFNKTYHEQV